MSAGGLVYLEVILLILATIVLGVLFTEWIEEALKRRGLSPLAVRSLRILFTVIWVSTSTGSPFRTYGLYRHCLTASMAAGANMG